MHPQPLGQHVILLSARALNICIHISLCSKTRSCVSTAQTLSNWHASQNNLGLPFVSLSRQALVKLWASVPGKQAGSSVEFSQASMRLPSRKRSATRLPGQARGTVATAGLMLCSCFCSLD